jgi:2-polyprenyl-3-methyl-5-hydroxy-6-metoxy-1,4-benzoquinol methylase
VNASVASWILRYGGVSPGAGAYLTLRCLGFPRLGAVERLLPTSGRILDLGCGHGLLAVLAAERQPSRDILGVDRLEERLEVGRRVASRHDVRNVRFEVGAIESPPPGPFEAIVVADVLLYRPIEAQRAIIEALVPLLSPGGRLVLKEQTREPSWKARLVTAQEDLVVGAKVRFGQSRSWAEMVPAGIHLWETAALERTLEDLGLATSHERLDRWSYLSHRVFIARRPTDLPLREALPLLSPAPDSDSLRRLPRA